MNRPLVAVNRFRNEFYYFPTYPRRDRFAGPNAMPLSENRVFCYFQNEKNDDGETPLDAVAKPEIADLLRKHGGKTGEEFKSE